MSIFILYVSAWVLFKVVFYLWVYLSFSLDRFLVVEIAANATEDENKMDQRSARRGAMAQWFECWVHNKSSHSQMFFRIDVLRNFAIFTGKHLCQGLFGLRLYQKEIPTQFHSFSVNIAKFVRTPFLQNTSNGCFCHDQELLSVLCSIPLPSKITRFTGRH